MDHDWLKTVLTKYQNWHLQSIPKIFVSCRIIYRCHGFSKHIKVEYCGNNMGCWSWWWWKGPEWTCSQGRALDTAVNDPELTLGLYPQAVSILRCFGVLELVVVKGAGVDLFPGESSGYNSSASSLAGDQSPDTWPHKRLSVVREESLIDTDR